MKNVPNFLIILMVLIFCCLAGCEQKKEKAAVEETAAADLQLDQVPPAVMAGLKAKFANAEIEKWEKEMEGEIVIYDFEFTQDGQKLEADVKEDGSIYNWEKAIEITALPEAAKTAAEAKYPDAAIKEIMEIMIVVDGADELDGYEIVLETADMKYVEVMVTPDGEILEDSGESQSAEE